MEKLGSKGFLKSLLQTALIAKKTLRPKEQKKLYLVVLIQFFLSLIDLLSLAFIGLLASLTISGVARKSNAGLVNEFLNKLNIVNLDIRNQVVILGVTSVTLIILRTISSLLLTRKVFRFLSNSSAALSKNLVELIVNADVAALRKFSTQEYVYASTFGVEALYLRILAPAFTLVADLMMLSLFGFALVIIDPFSAILTITLLLLISLILDKLQATKVTMHGKQSTELDIKSRSRLAETIESIREIRVRNRENFIVSNYGQDRQLVANSIAFNNWVAYSNKYIVEATLILGGMIVAGIEFGLSDAVKAISSLALFLAASMRMAPAALRIQQSVIQARACLPPAQKMLEIYGYLHSINLSMKVNESPTTVLDFTPKISISNLYVNYVGASDSTLKGINLEISSGDFVAITGESGSGKSTLVDALLGLIPIQSGAIEISGLSPSQAITNFPGKISYLPQNTFISNENIRKNVSYGFPEGFFKDEEIIEALKKADLFDWFLKTNNGLDTELGENGVSLSGGQRQRIGLARALLTKPSLLILDEATSALDEESEKRISNTVKELGREITRIVIAHRLSSIKNADVVVVLKDGSILKVGKPNEVLDLKNQ